MVELLLGTWSSALPTCLTKSSLAALLQTCLRYPTSPSTYYQRRRTNTHSQPLDKLGDWLWTPLLSMPGQPNASCLSMHPCNHSCCSWDFLVWPTQLAGTMGPGKHSWELGAGSTPAFKPIHESRAALLITCSVKCAQGNCPRAESWTSLAVWIRGNWWWLCASPSSWWEGSFNHRCDAGLCADQFLHATWQAQKNFWW